MKSIFSALIALGFLTGAVNAAPISQTQTDTVIEYGCGYGR